MLQYMILRFAGVILTVCGIPLFGAHILYRCLVKEGITDLPLSRCQKVFLSAAGATYAVVLVVSWQFTMENASLKLLAMALLAAALQLLGVALMLGRYTKQMLLMEALAVSGSMGAGFALIQGVQLLFQAFGLSESGG